MPLVENLVDNFDDGTLNASIWNQNYGNVREQDGRGGVGCNSGYSAIQSMGQWQLAGSSMFAELFLPADSGVTCWFAFSHPTTSGTLVGFYYTTSNNTLRFWNATSWWDGSAPTVTYNAMTHRWMRLRESAGTLYWETSPDGSTWTVRRNIATPAWVTSATTGGVFLEGYRDVATTVWAEIDNLNVPLSSDVDANAGEAGGSAAALNVTVLISESRQVAAGAAQVDATAGDEPDLKVGVHAASGTGESTTQDATPTGATNALASTATGAGSGQNATISTEAITNVNAAVAEADIETASAPAGVKIAADLLAVSGAAHDATVDLATSAHAGLAAVDVEADDPGTRGSIKGFRFGGITATFGRAPGAAVGGVSNVPHTVSSLATKWPELIGAAATSDVVIERIGKSGIVDGLSVVEVSISEDPDTSDHPAVGGMALSRTVIGPEV